MFQAILSNEKLPNLEPAQVGSKFNQFNMLRVRGTPPVTPREQHRNAGSSSMRTSGGASGHHHHRLTWRSRDVRKALNVDATPFNPGPQLLESLNC